MSRASLRTKLLAIGLIGVIGALLLAGITVWSMSMTKASEDERNASANVAQAAHEAMFLFADTAALQKGYALDANTIGAKAVAPESDKRKIFVQRLEELRTRIATDPGVATEVGKATWKEMTELTAKYAEIDDRAVAEIAKGTPAGIAAGQKLIDMDGNEITKHLINDGTTLIKAANERQAKSIAEEGKARTLVDIVVGATLLLVIGLFPLSPSGCLGSSWDLWCP